jgi:hypothetical protein
MCDIDPHGNLSFAAVIIVGTICWRIVSIVRLRNTTRRVPEGR